MKLDNIYLAGIGTYLPERVSTADAVDQGLLTAEEREASGVLSVAVGGDVPAPDMAVHAANEALKRSEHDTADIGLLIHSSVHHQGPDGWSAPHYILRNTVDRPVSAFEIRHGCLGLMTSMELAANFLATRTGHDAALLTAADNYGTPGVDRWRSGGVFLMGDGGSAVVLSQRGGFARLLATGSISDPAMEEIHRGGEELFPPGATRGRSLNLSDRMVFWRELWAKGITPPMSHAGDIVTAVVERTLGEAGLVMSDITRVAHPGVDLSLLRTGFLDPLGFTLAQGTWEFTRRLGHAGGTDQIAGLEHLLGSGEVGPGDHVLLLSKTSGMEAGAAVLRIERAL